MNVDLEKNGEDQPAGQSYCWVGSWKGKWRQMWNFIRQMKQGQIGYVLRQDGLLQKQQEEGE